MTAPLVELRAVSKRFGAQQALDRVDFSAHAGEVHAIIGENGAGKSTLMKILSGALQPDAGTLHLRGQRVVLHTPAQARRRGVAMIYQELTLAPQLSVAANIMLGVEPHRAGFLRTPYAAMRQILTTLGHDALDLDAPAGSLSISEQQVVEIARALVLDAAVVIFDEPTSSLTQADTQALFDVIRRLQSTGIAVIYISHFLEEILQIADRCTVLRDGARVGERRVNETTLDELVRLMVGRAPTTMFPRAPRTPGAVALEFTPARQCILRVRRGEILGIAGLVGSGRSHLLRALVGLRRAARGRVTLHGHTTMPLRAMTPRRALAHGMQLVSEDRKDEGLAIALSVRDNVSLPALPARFMRACGMLRLAAEQQACAAACAAVRIKSGGLRQPVSGLSGGNQQKVALARVRLRGGDILLLDEPTRGIDIGSKIEIYGLLNEWAAAGAAIVMVSSYLPELLGVCDTVAVMHRGALSPLRPVTAWTPESVMQWATTGKQ